MGSHMKKSIFDEQTSKSLKKWHMAVKKKHGGRGGKSPTHTLGDINYLLFSIFCLFVWFFYFLQFCPKTRFIVENSLGNFTFFLCSFLCLVGLGKMGERDRLDGSSWGEPAFSICWPGSHLSESFHGE